MHCHYCGRIAIYSWGSNKTPTCAMCATALRNNYWQVTGRDMLATKLSELEESNEGLCDTKEE